MRLSGEIYSYDTITMEKLGMADYTDLTKKMESYILSGGVYGSTENRVMVAQGKSGGKLRYAWSRVFLPYKLLKNYYPILEKHRWLTPVMEVVRWFRILFGGRLRQSTQELRINQSVSAQTVDQTKAFLQELGL